LEIAIGVIFVYLVLSLICTAVNEAIATVVNKRGENLFEGVKNLLNDPTFTGLAQQVYNHGLVDGISKEMVNPDTNRRPSYLPSKTFSLALLDILSAHGVVSAAHGKDLKAAEDADDKYQKLLSKPGVDEKGSEVVAAKAAHEEGRAKLVNAEAEAKTAYDAAVADAAAEPTDAQKQAIAQAKAALDRAGAAVKILDARRAAIEAARNPNDKDRVRQASNALETSLAAGRELAALIPDRIENVQAAVARLPPGHTRETLLVLIDKSKREAGEVGSHLAHFQQNVETWFNDSMDRVSGWYKRWTQKWQIILAVVVVLLVNADTVMLTRRFASDKDLRSAVLAQAEKAAQQPDINKLSTDIQSYSLPVGWSYDANDSRHFPWIVAAGEPNPMLAGAGQFFTKLLGLLISIGAVSLGGQFWFDTLSKFVNIRGAGTPPGEKKKSAG
jgi:hypothetical protein